MIVYKFLDIPKEVICKIFSFLQPKELIEYYSLNKYVFESLDSEEFWEQMCFIWFESNQITYLTGYDIWMKGNFILKWNKSKNFLSDEYLLVNKKKMKIVQSIRQKEGIVKRKHLESVENHQKLPLKKKIKLAFEKIETMKAQIMYLELLFSKMEELKQEEYSSLYQISSY